MTLAVTGSEAEENVNPGRISWLGGVGDSCQRWVAYRGEFEGAGLRLHYGFDGWQEPVQEIPMETIEPGFAVAEIDQLDGHLAVDCAVTRGDEWDNNGGFDHRLWIGFDALDAHLHVSGGGAGALGIRSLGTAMASAGIVAGI